MYERMLTVYSRIGERNELASLRAVEEAITVAEARVVRDTFVLQHFS